MRRIFRILPIILPLTLCTCAQAGDTPDGPRESWRWVATVSGIDRITQIHVSSLLKSQGIDCIMEGSIGYGVSVPTKDVDRSIGILKKDLAKRRYWITLYEGKKEQQYSVPDELWGSKRLDKKYEDVIRLKDYGGSTDLGAVLRHPDVTDAARAFSYVAEVKTLKREYLGEDGKIRTGHEVKLELVANLKEEIGGWRFSFQVWDGGKEIETQGGSEWWQGDPATVGANKKKYDHRTTAPRGQRSGEPAERRKQ